MSYKIIRRAQTINDNTKIKYLSILGKVYEVTSIQWTHSYLEAKETDLNAGDVDESELWDISYFENYNIKLVNGRGKAEVINMREWMERNHKNVR